MKLYHFSDKDFTVLKPDFFGENTFTKNDSKFPYKRFFCYDTAKPKEHCFKASNFRYTIDIDKRQIYNLDDDILRLKEAFNFDIDKILTFCNNKYHGISYSTSFKTYAIFKEAKIILKEAFVSGKLWE